MSAVQSAWSAWITKKHSASAMAPHGRGATPFHQCWWNTPTYSMPYLTHCHYLAAAGTLVVGIECRLPAEFLFGSSFFLQYNDEYTRDNSQEMYKLTFQ